MPLNDVTRNMVDTGLFALPVALLVMVIGAGSTFMLMRHVHRPLVSLAAAVARLRDGDLSTPIPKIEHGELALLAEQLELARRSLRVNVEAMATDHVRQRALFAALREPILTTLLSGEITGCNPAAAALFGSSSSLVGQPVHELLPFLAMPSSPGEEEEIWQGSIANAAGGELDVEVRRATLIEGSLPACHVYVVHDISRYAELNRLREQLLYDVSHEFGAPLAVLDSSLEILADEYGELSAKEFDHLMGSARHTVRRLRALLDGLLSAGAIKSGRFVVHTEPIELPVIISEAKDTVEAQIQAHRQRVDCQIPDDFPCVLADRRYACQVVANLLSNASKYSPDGEVILVEAAKLDCRVRVTVEDRGPGIPAEQQERLFDRFYRLRQGYSEPGIGLGLAIVKGIVEAHGGSIGIDSTVGTGTRVWFTLLAAERDGIPNPTR